MAWLIERGVDRIAISGELRIGDAPKIWGALNGATRRSLTVLDLDLSRASAIDGAIMALLVELRAGLQARGVKCELVGAGERLAPVVHLYHGDVAPTAVAPRPHSSLLERLGSATTRALYALAAAAAFTGELASATWAVVRGRARTNWRALPSLVERAGADAMPIVLLLNFLVGFVGAFQSTGPLRQFGANVYVADIIGVSVTRELSPLITAIIISGRSGAAYAAELGTMRVSDEIDALRTMGFAPHPYLVLPRVIALALVSPFLALLGDVAGVFGGFAVGIFSLDLTSTGFLTELRQMVVLPDVWTGLAKSFAFGITIALVGCQQGLATRGAAAGVGRGTTATVVTCLFSIVVLDTLFTMLFRGFGV